MLAAADAWHALGGRGRTAPRSIQPAAGDLLGPPLDRDVIRGVLGARSASRAPRPPADRPAQLDVLRRLVIGRTKREIAAELVLSPSTVHTHTVHIYAKCGVSTRAALAMFAMRHGLTAAVG